MTDTPDRRRAAPLRIPARVLAVLGASGCLMEVNLTDNVLDTGTIIEPPAPVDLDQDGYAAEAGDCDDLDPERGPDAQLGGDARFEERCDGIDNDCVGGVDADRSGFEVCAERRTFDQTLRLDLLVVVDRQVTNQDARVRAASAARDLVRPLLGPGYETHIGVITTDLHDGRHRGRLIAPPMTEATASGAAGLSGARTYLGATPIESASAAEAEDESTEATTPAGDPGDDPDADARRWIDGGSDSEAWAAQFLANAILGSGVQQAGGQGGRAAVDLAMTTRLEAANAGFFRPGAPLGVVFVSASEDGSTTPALEPFLDFLDGWSDEVRLHAVVQDTSLGCDGVSAPEREGGTYLDLAALTQGLSLSVCAPDYAPFFGALGQYSAIHGLATRFPLGEVAQADSLEVTLSLPGGSGTDGFHRRLRADEVALTDEGRTLVLLVDPPPPAGSQIAVDYLRQP